MREAVIHRQGKWLFFDKGYIAEFVYGGIDGAITTFAVVAGATGADADLRWVLIFGFANLLADGFSMSVGNYFSTRAEQDNYEKHKAIEYWEIENLREREVQEIRDIYAAKGFKGQLLEDVVATITANKDVWVDTMMKEELEMAKESRSPLSTAVATFISFNAVGLIPLVVYIVALFTEIREDLLFPVSCAGTGVAMAVVGYMRGVVTDISKAKSIIQTLLLGGLAAACAYFAGEVLARWIL